MKKIKVEVRIKNQNISKPNANTVKIIIKGNQLKKQVEKKLKQASGSFCFMAKSRSDIREEVIINDKRIRDSDTGSFVQAQPGRSKLPKRR